jgi:hypothetical protein
LKSFFATLCEAAISSWIGFERLFEKIKAATRDAPMIKRVI